MGKYSLDTFERYPLVKLRPAMTGPDLRCYRLLELSWPELGPETGILISQAESGDGAVLLRLLLDKTEDISEVCRFIRQIGACFSGGRALAGVVMDPGAYSGKALNQLARAYRQGFDAAFLLAEPGSEIAKVCRREGIQTGLWLPITEGVLTLRRRIAEGDLARGWEHCPVYICAKRALTLEELDAARRWHASGADSMAPLGARMTLRRMMFPKDLTSGGLMPLRMWWQNIGTAPLYHETRVLLELGNEKDRFPISITENMNRPGLGDSTFNITAQLPPVPCGTYTLWCGLESGGRKLVLAMDTAAVDGMYEIGEITLDDTPRPYLRTMWETQYADGYYPLEDPSQPE